MFRDMINLSMLIFCFTDLNLCCWIQLFVCLFGRLNDGQCYEWTEKLEVNKSCGHVIPLYCNPAEWRVDACGAEIWSCQEEAHSSRERTL